MQVRRAVRYNEALVDNLHKVPLDGKHSISLDYTHGKY